MFGLLCACCCAVASVVVGVGICKKLGMFKSETTPEDLGDRALQAYYREGIKPDDYKGRYDEYMKKIESIELDPAESLRLSK